MEQEIRCRRLKCLCFNQVFLDSMMLQKVISNCSLIESLEISGCVGIRNNIKLTGLPHLKRFRLCHDADRSALQSIEIEAPRLELLDCFYYGDVVPDGDGGLSLKNCLLTLHTPQYQNMKNLSVSGFRMDGPFYSNLERKFPHLEIL